MIRLTRWSRQFHRWIAYVLGAVITLWIVTGVAMVLPPPPTTRPVDLPSIDPVAAVRSPREAALALSTLGDQPVRSLALRDLGGRLVYHFALDRGDHVFVDATTAQRVELTDSLALALARRVMFDTSITTSVRKLTQHDSRYRVGALPAYRIELNDPSRTLIHIAGDGTIFSTSSRSRLRQKMAAWHEFQLPGNVVPGRLRKVLVLGASALTLCLVLTGYVLALPLRRRT